jgi:hypothetical protein
MKRSPMPRGSGFKRPERPERVPIVYRRMERSGVYAPSTDVVLAVPKEEEARPGKRAPTVEEERWLRAIVEFGCIACWLDGFPSRPPAVHHILRGNQRMGHLHSLPLCDPGHHQSGQPLGLVSRHPWKTRFEEKYGTEQELLQRLRQMLGFM